MDPGAPNGHRDSTGQALGEAPSSTGPRLSDRTNLPSQRISNQVQDDADALESQIEEEHEQRRPQLRHVRNSSTSPARKSIHFTRDTTGPKTRTPVHSRHASLDAGPPDGSGHESSRAKLKSKMRAIGLPLKPPAHARTRSGGASGENSSSGYETVSEPDGDADAESNAAETPAPPRWRRPLKPIRTLSQTVPNTPMDARFREDFNLGSGSPVPRHPAFARRRASTTDVPEGRRDGYSEDEGRERYAKPPAWRRRGSAWLHATPQQGSGLRRRSKQDLLDSVRPSHLRRLTQFGSGAAADGSPAAPRPRREKGERWREVRRKVKDLIAQRKKAEKSSIDVMKSAQLVSGMLAGSPAAVILASNFLRDEHNRKKVPVLLEQLKLEVPDSITQDDSDRHQSFCIRLEYGSGRMRMRWEVWRSLIDFVNLHANFKVLSSTMWIKRHGENPGRIKLPRFPRSAFPVMRTWRGFADDGEEEEDGAAVEASGHERDSARQIQEKRNRRSSSHQRPHLSGLGRPGPLRNPSSAGLGVESQGPHAAAAKRAAFIEKQRKKLEVYLRELIRFVVFRQGNNRLCKFLEISTLGINLAAEAGYHGKEGLLSLTSNMRRDIKGNLRKKWFMVRQSYIACVETPESMVLVDVFLVDPEFRIDDQRPRVRDQQTPVDMAKTAKSSVAHPKHHMIRMFNRERTWTLFAMNERQQDQFAQSIKRMKAETVWSQPHRFDSFAPQRKNVFTEWLVDGRDYMWKVSRAIDNARHVVYIHDWWISPELFMRRPREQHLHSLVHCLILTDVRVAAISSRWRLDRLLQRKAEQGVKIYIIMYKNIDSAIPIDSTHSKNVLLDLHPNIYIMRSPNNLKQNTLFWAHHEKICIVDHIIGFCGGLDLCFGRWDTPEHRVVDDKPTGLEIGPFPRDAEHTQSWPGKDYSNARVLDFYDLSEPYEEMYDRRKVPRMPWHDIGMQMVGQPARDLSRHFVQRWNFLLRNRNPSRPIPCLIPPPEFDPEDLQRLDLRGTCEVQMLRSACDWSLGTPERTEHSIMNAYIKLIECSEHFIYIENQFFISSCQVDNTRIQNLVGDALVERIIRAHEKGEDWLAVILIPLMPGFANPVNEPGGASVRLIMQCQYRSICRGETSIFGRLRARGIQPEDYVRFYSLRAWGKIGPTKALTTEQLYIHAKCMIVDDRQFIIGSANINERSQLGTRDSEVAAVVFDTEMIDSIMAGKPYKVSRRAHDLRMRLMREHIGVNVDAIRDAECQKYFARASSVKRLNGRMNGVEESAEEQLGAEPGSSEFMEHWSWQTGSAMPLDVASQDGSAEAKENIPPREHKNSKPPSQGTLTSFPNEADSSASVNHALPCGRDSVILEGAREVLVAGALAESKSAASSPRKLARENDQGSEPSSEESSSRYTSDMLPPPMMPRLNTLDAGLTIRSQLPPLPTTDDTNIGGPPSKQTFSQGSAETLNPFLATLRLPIVTNECMRDPLNDSFFEDTWHAVAENNTRIFRQVFRCNPDDEVKDWDDYDAFIAYRRRFDQSMGIATTQQDEQASKARPPGPEDPDKAPAGNAEKEESPKHWGFARKPSKSKSDVEAQEKEQMAEKSGQTDGVCEMPKRTEGLSAPDELNEKKEAPGQSPEMTERVESKTSSAESKAASGRRRRRATTKSSFPLRASDPAMNKADAEELLNMVQGHLVIFPYHWYASLTCPMPHLICHLTDAIPRLEIVEDKSAWLYPFDQVSPLEI